MSEHPEPPGIVNRDAYCREIESYLCRKNDGHLIRIVGPAFDLVQGWADAGIPLKVVQAAIDRTFERYYRKGPRRRPIHISFCDADVLDLFDDWRRALGVPSPAPGAPGQEVPAARSHESLPAHLERVVHRLTLRRGGECPPEVDAVLERLVRVIDAARGSGKPIRGEARAALLANLAQWDDEVLDLAARLTTPGQQSAAAHEADEELAPFRERMSPPAYETARTAAIARLIREAARLPVLRYE